MLNWERRARGAVASGRVFPYLAATTAGLAIVVGVTFISFLTATVTSYFVALDQEAEQAREHEFRVASDNETRELIRQLDSRLAAIERALHSAWPE